METSWRQWNVAGGLRGRGATPAGGRRPDFARDGRRGEDWRYRFDNGIWWYWLPGNRWSYYRDGDWADYDDGGNVAVGESQSYDTASQVADMPSDPRYYWYQGQWWYWLPSNRWTTYDRGEWHDAAPGTGPQRREMGYRGFQENRGQNGNEQSRGNTNGKDANDNSAKGNDLNHNGANGSDTNRNGANSNGTNGTDVNRSNTNGSQDIHPQGNTAERPSPAPENRSSGNAPHGESGPRH